MARCMKTPRGFVTARMAAKKKRIWIQPLAVKTLPPSETLRLQQGVAEMGEKAHGQEQADDVFQAHGRPSDALAGPDVEPGEQEEGQRDRDEHDVEHRTPSEEHPAAGVLRGDRRTG